ncbi:VOC family protein [Streptomyces sp. NBC_01476]|uniref:VOC family protein n=1 Tax=Streptomyces sp. NBC_01476 TaxID=2903881 RepID=UPI002E35B3C0|nr:VOC family protein [Streptomyces sp. NBC_01476]
MTNKLSVYPTLRYQDARAAITMLKDAFGFTEVAVYENEDGTVAHAELAYGNGMVMLGTARAEGRFGELARDLGPVSVYVAVEDADVHHARAVSYGVKVVMPLTDQEYGSRDYIVRDAEGNLWTFGTYAPELPGQNS